MEQEHNKLSEFGLEVLREANKEWMSNKYAYSSKTPIMRGQCAAVIEAYGKRMLPGLFLD